MRKISSDFDEVIGNVTDDVLFQCMHEIQNERIHDTLSDENMDHPVVSKFLWESVINGLSVEDIASAMSDCAHDAVIGQLDVNDPNSEVEVVFCFDRFLEELSKPRAFLDAGGRKWAVLALLAVGDMLTEVNGFEGKFQLTDGPVDMDVETTTVNINVIVDNDVVISTIEGMRERGCRGVPTETRLLSDLQTIALGRTDELAQRR